MQIVDTYSSDGEPHKRASVSFKFVLLRGNSEKVSFLKSRIADFNQFKSLAITESWIYLDGRPLLNDGEKQPTECSHCRRAIVDELETVALNKERAELRLYCAECSLLGREFYEKYHNHYQRTQILDHKHCLIMTNLH